ncbi:hypothetical protein D3C86_2014640 [compost metagenome]
MIASSIAWNTCGTPAITCTLPMAKPGAVETGLGISRDPSGIRAMRLRTSENSMPRRSYIAPSSAMARSSWMQSTPNAFETASAVMSSWVGPIPPEVKI